MSYRIMGCITSVGSYFVRGFILFGIYTYLPSESSDSSQHKYLAAERALSVSGYRSIVKAVYDVMLFMRSHDLSEVALLLNLV
jgi:hypothetical protein